MTPKLEQRALRLKVSAISLPTSFSHGHRSVAPQVHAGFSVTSSSERSPFALYARALYIYASSGVLLTGTRIKCKFTEIQPET